MNLTAEEIQNNWLRLIGFIEDHISSPRKENLLKFYDKYQERLILMPAAHKKEYHNAFPGGYVEHVNRVITCALHLHELWGQMGADLTTYTKEELVFLLSTMTWVKWVMKKMIHTFLKQTIGDVKN